VELIGAREASAPSPRLPYLQFPRKPPFAESRDTSLLLITLCTHRIPGVSDALLPFRRRCHSRLLSAERLSPLHPTDSRLHMGNAIVNLSRHDKIRFGTKSRLSNHWRSRESAGRLPAHGHTAYPPFAIRDQSDSHDG
jgi:hypothetical protein